MSNSAIDEARRIFGRITSYTIYRVALTLDIMLLVVLLVFSFKFVPLTAVMIVMMSLLDDLPIMTIAYDQTLVAKRPIRWNMPRVLGVSTVLGLFSVVQSFGLLLIGLEGLKDPNVQQTLGYATEAQLKTAVFLQLIAGGYLLLFITRTERWFFLPPYPAPVLFWSIMGTQLIGVLMCGFGWLIEPISWKLIGWVWLYNIVWMFILGGVRLTTERFANHSTARHLKS